MMSRVAPFLCLALVSAVPFHAGAIFVWYETQQVPIDRLFRNLQQRLAQNTNNFEVTYDLARLHSMAYSTNLLSIGVRTNSAIFGHDRHNRSPILSRDQSVK